MNWRILLFGAAVAAGSALLTTQVVSQDHPAQDHPAQDHPAHDDMERMMARWAEMAAPGEHHKRLDVMIGTWDQTVEWWQAPGAPPNVSQGSTTYEWVLGNRFIQGRYKGELMGGVFEGIDIIGYDNFRKEYVSFWIDNMSTAMHHSRGTYKSDANAIELIGKYDDVMTGERDKRMRHVTRFVDDDHLVFEMFSPGPTGEEFMTLRISSKRKQ